LYRQKKFKAIVESFGFKLVNKQIVLGEGNGDTGSGTSSSSTAAKGRQAKATSKAPAKKSSARGGPAKKRKVEDVTTDDELARFKEESDSENDSEIEVTGFRVDRGRSTTVKAETAREEETEQEV